MTAANFTVLRDAEKSTGARWKRALAARQCALTSKEISMLVWEKSTDSTALGRVKRALNILMIKQL